MDVESEGKLVDLHVLEYIHIHKTARLLEAVPVCGVIIGSVDKANMEKLRSYARSIGLLF
ncbi:geranylgeranyl pyrophosphate synthase, chloroplastic [Canna indica]|uniref:Geranylgeranyl pyrophosphate synthase, chloroplastic n=1 Tax=Canna indica TaxID=4628 RepID=A0AAQ3QKN7_9LILI|nr:geranylgeranyl pyrophosphate synthase, chloroplastic [Canna indica]